MKDLCYRIQKKLEENIGENKTVLLLEEEKHLANCPACREVKESLLDLDELLLPLKEEVPPNRMIIKRAIFKAERETNARVSLKEYAYFITIAGLTFTLLGIVLAGIPTGDINGFIYFQGIIFFLMPFVFYFINSSRQSEEVMD